METAFAPVVGVIELAPSSTARRRETANVMSPRTLGDDLERLVESRAHVSDAAVAEADWTDLPPRRRLVRRRRQRRFSPLSDRFAAPLAAAAFGLARRTPERVLLANVMQLADELRREWTQLRSRLSPAA